MCVVHLPCLKKRLNITFFSFRKYHLGQSSTPFFCPYSYGSCICSLLGCSLGLFKTHESNLEVIWFWKNNKAGASLSSSNKLPPRFAKSSKYLKIRALQGPIPRCSSLSGESSIHIASYIFCRGSPMYTSSLTISLNSRLVYGLALLGTSNLRLIELSFPCPVFFSEASPSH